MLVNPISNQSFQAVNQKYYQWAQKEAKGGKRFSELFTQLRYDVDWGDVHAQDGIDTLEAIKKLIGTSNQVIEKILESFRARLKK